MNIDAVSPFSRNRAGEADLCQFPDRRCDLERHDGTGYCFIHIDIMRGRAIRGESAVVTEAERLEAEVQKDEESWTRVFGMTSPIDAFAGEVQ